MLRQKKYFTKVFLAAIGFLAISLPAHALSIPNPMGSVNTPEDLISNIIKTILGVTGSIALLMFVWGGFMWLTSAGNSERVQKGKNVFIWAAAGLLVIFSSYAILRTLFDIFK